ncbi:Lrp/AsnC family transcriptional regulator [Endozoicomonas sp. SM1973]|uniref:Lrp/AsnC family transcriptional regulator n=1 Tax=Spartinivicinus marinus TaxID=2994442 RepID=A0A853HZ27_9GAMM|nr:Lrp/AsnC family transcriptional regulator [Spartinivicinus marinus]MCX4027381.1 Lrp/AsnC family transcriptional regulator [Spartinivicinus marinus]NYZ66443.1 Lrp/AsnC family transcriptional regulator [Spartinivicinus marinus]
MDKFDQLIIEALSKDARQPVAAIAEQVNLSRSAVSERIKKLEQNGTIKGYQVLLRESEKGHVAALIEIQYFGAKCEEAVIPVITRFPEVKQCFAVSGDTDLIIYVRAENMQKIMQLYEALNEIEGVTKIKTHVVMNEWINRLGG